MGEPKTTRWLITGRGHWLMVVAAWIMSIVAGIRIEEATKDAEWISPSVAVLASLVFWAAALRVKDRQG